MTSGKSDQPVETKPNTDLDFSLKTFTFIHLVATIMLLKMYFDYSAT